MRGHLQCRDTLAGNEGCPLKTGTTVHVCSSASVFLLHQNHQSSNVENESNDAEYGYEDHQLRVICPLRSSISPKIAIDSGLFVATCPVRVCNGCAQAVRHGLSKNVDAIVWHAVVICRQLICHE